VYIYLYVYIPAVYAEETHRRSSYDIIIYITYSRCHIIILLLLYARGRVENIAVIIIIISVVYIGTCALGESTTTTTPNGYKSREIGRDDKNLHRFTSGSISTNVLAVYTAHSIIGRSVTYIIIILYAAYYPTTEPGPCHISRVFRRVKNIITLRTATRVMADDDGPPLITDHRV